MENKAKLTENIEHSYPPWPSLFFSFTGKSMCICSQVRTFSILFEHDSTPLTYRSTEPDNDLFDICEQTSKTFFEEWEGSSHNLRWSHKYCQ